MQKAERVKVGEIFGMLTVVGPVYAKGRYLYAPVTCVCGKSKSVEQASLRKGVSMSCGCLSARMTGDRSRTHGKRADPIYAVWNAMVQRCTNPNSKQWEDYGKRGIGVDERWLTFENFFADMGDAPFKGATLERQKNDKGYSKANCIWSTRQVNNLNRRNTVKLLYLGEMRTLVEIALLCGVNYSTLYQRIHTYKWPLSEATDPTPSPHATRERRPVAALAESGERMKDRKR